MVIKKVITVPNPILRQKSKPVKKIDKKVKNLIKNLKNTLEASKEPKGVGLSAPQIGVSKRVTVIKRVDRVEAFINPKIISSSKKTLKDVLPEDKRSFEGCLSAPGIWAFVNRPAKVKVSYLDEEGKKKTEKFTGQASICIQHEIDHLNGVLFVDRALKQGSKLYKQEKDEEGKIVFVELEIE